MFNLKLMEDQKQALDKLIYEELLEKDSSGTLKPRPGISKSQLANSLELLKKIQLGYVNVDEGLKELQAEFVAFDKKQKSVRKLVKKSKYASCYINQPMISAILGVK